MTQVHGPKKETCFWLDSNKEIQIYKSAQELLPLPPDVFQPPTDSCLLPFNARHACADAASWSDLLSVSVWVWVWISVYSRTTENVCPASNSSSTHSPSSIRQGNTRFSDSDSFMDFTIFLFCVLCFALLSCLAFQPILSVIVSLLVCLVIHFVCHFFSG